MFFIVKQKLFHFHVISLKTYEMESNANKMVVYCFMLVELILGNRRFMARAIFSNQRLSEYSPNHINQHRYREWIRNDTNTSGIYTTSEGI